MDLVPVIGLEVHVEVDTRSKLFCSCPVDPSAEPNTLICPQCAGLPGAMPTLNREAIRLGVLAGLALNCRINLESAFDRKHYFYPDLPKGYQLTQFFFPLCEGGVLHYLSEGEEKQLSITRIHVEEDAGKLTHTPCGTGIDLNRCGVPLLEIVTGPELHTPREAGDAFRVLREVLVFAGVTQGRMNLGHLRCDLNISLHRPGDPLGTRTETKNLNSFSGVEDAAAAEIRRQTRILQQGGTIHQETMHFSQKTGETSPMRPKETEADYRYFPEPDLPRLVLEKEWLTQLQQELPELPYPRRLRYAAQGLKKEESRLLSARREWAEAFDRACGCCDCPPLLAKLFTGVVFTEQAKGVSSVDDPIALPFPPERLGKIAQMQKDESINAATAKSLCTQLFQGDFDPEEKCRRESMLLLTDPQELRRLAQATLSAEPSLTQEYRQGKIKVFPVLMGKAMAAGRGQAHPEKLKEALRVVLEENTLQ